MTKEEVVQALQRGGDSRNNAIRYIYKSAEVRRALRKSLGSFEKKLFRTHKIYLEEVLTDAIIKMDQKISRGKFGGETFETVVGYIAKEAYYRCLDRVRALELTNIEEVNEYSSVPEQSISYSIEETFIQKEKASFLRNILSGLGKNCKEILLMKYENYTDEEIALKLDYTLDSVKSKRNRCNKQLESFFANNPETTNYLKKD